MKIALILFLTFGLISDPSGESPTVEISPMYSSMLEDGQLYLEFDVQDNKVFTNDETLLRYEIVVGHHFDVLNALILMEIEPDLAARAKTQSTLQSGALRDMYYSEDHINTLEGAIYMGNSEYFVANLNKYRNEEIAMALEGYSKYFSYDSTSGNILNTISSSPLKLAQFFLDLNAGVISTCEENVSYICTLMSDYSEAQMSQEQYIITKSSTAYDYINIGYTSSGGTPKIKFYQEKVSVDDPDGLSDAMKNNYEVMNIYNETPTFGEFGE